MNHFILKRVEILDFYKSLHPNCNVNTLDKQSGGFDYPIVLLEEFFAVSDDNACTAPTMAYEDISVLLQALKNNIDVDYDDEIEMNYAAQVLQQHPK
ncbi:hypothetical protein TNCV_3577811 [Trichonephila clavipes]|uniref:Uncharacterized protein n=1 Tax=Trichonephila clavipes TaxID=2585209 RepID=A0A8X6UTG9_TRICX|nr:hypothetical protein TNCV_3577811 [Trichonephila clavipes]